MAKYVIENEKYIIRPIEEGDKEQVTNLIRENKYLKRIWSLESMGSTVDKIIQSVYVNSEASHCIFSKKTGDFCGYVEIKPEEEIGGEGELAVRLTDEVDIVEIMKIFGNVFSEIGHSKEKNITIQYTFD